MPRIEFFDTQNGLNENYHIPIKEFFVYLGQEFRNWDESVSNFYLNFFSSRQVKQ